MTMTDRNANLDPTDEILMYWSKRYKRWFSAARWWKANGTLVGLGVMALATGLTTHPSKIDCLRGLLIGVGSSMVVVLFLQAKLWLGPLSRRVANIDDVCSVGALVDALCCLDRRSRGSVQDALIRLLPRVGQEKADLIDSSRREILCRILQSKTKEVSPMLKDAIFDLLVRLSETDGGRCIQSIAESRSNGSAGFKARAAAILCATDTPTDDRAQRDTLIGHTKPHEQKTERDLR